MAHWKTRYLPLLASVALVAAAVANAFYDYAATNFNW